MLIRLQRSEKKHAEVKHVVAYEGKEELTPGRFALQNKLVVSGIGEGEEILEEASAKMANKWDLSFDLGCLFWERWSKLGQKSV